MADPEFSELAIAMLLILVFICCAAVVADNSLSDCHFLPTKWSSHGGWWCCRLATITIERNSTIRVLPRISDKCAEAFPKLLVSRGAGKSAEESSGFVIWLVAVSVVVFVLFSVLAIFLVCRFRRKQGISRASSVESGVVNFHARGGVNQFDRLTCTTSARTSRCGEPAVGAFDDGAGRLTAMRVWVAAASRATGNSGSRGDVNPKDVAQLASIAEGGGEPAGAGASRDPAAESLSL